MDSTIKSILSHLNDRVVLVTGGAGYIGSCVCNQLKRYGISTVVVDSLESGRKNIVEDVLKLPLRVGNIGDTDFMQSVFDEFSVGAVMHFSAYCYVGESVTKPLTYYKNNFSNTLSLLEVMNENACRNFVFSSTCATFGDAKKIPIDEDHPQNPINPYGHSKLMVERVLSDLDQAHDFKSVIFRYFNAAGASEDGMVGEDHDPETHLIPLAIEVALGQRDSISVFGNDYPTPDGTCIRDYIHVDDLAEAHIRGLDHLLSGKGSADINLGNGDGYSVLEVLKTVEEVSGQTVKVEMSGRRAGDPPRLIGNNTRAQSVLGWKPRRNLKKIIEDAYRWHKSQDKA